MTAFVDQCSLQGGITGVTMSPPVQPTQARDRVVIWANNKLEDKIPPTPSGWRLVSTAAVGTGAQGVDTGPIRQTFFETDLATAMVSTPLTPAGGSVNILGGGVVLRPAADEVILPATALSASDVTLDTAVACVMPSNQGFSLRDWLIQSVSLTHGSPGLPGRGVTMPGCTMTGHSGGSLGLNSTPQNTTGNHQYTYTEVGQVTAGAQSAPATAIGTTTTPTTGGATHLLIRTARIAVAAATLPAPVATAVATRRVGVVAVATLPAPTATLLASRTVRAFSAALLLGPTAAAVALRTVRAIGLAVLPRAIGTAAAGTTTPVEYAPAGTPIASTRAGDRTAATRSSRYTAVTRTVGGSASTREG